MKTPIKLDAKIDLHGYTLQAAFDIFVKFIEYCVENQFHNLLVVTGKGNNKGNNSEQTISYEFPHWCENKKIAGYIKSFKKAEIQHGGDGAFYVKLR